MTYALMWRAQAAAIFAPRTLTVCVSSAAGDVSAVQLACLPGYAALGCTCQSLANGMFVTVHSLQAVGRPAAAAAAAEGMQLEEAAAQLPGAEDAAGNLVEECAAVVMQEDDQKSELTGVLDSCFDMVGSGGAGEEAVLMAVGGYASSMASDIAKTWPFSPEADWAGKIAIVMSC